MTSDDPAATRSDRLEISGADTSMASAYFTAGGVTTIAVVIFVVTLAQRGWQTDLLALGFLAFFAFAAAVMLFIGWRRWNASIRLDPAGLRVRGAVSTWSAAWRDIEEFGVVELSSRNEVIHCVALRYAPGAGSRPLFAFFTRLSGPYDRLLPISGDEDACAEYAATLNDWRRRFAGAPPPEPSLDTPWERIRTRVPRSAALWLAIVASIGSLFSLEQGEAVPGAMLLGYAVMALGVVTDIGAAAMNLVRFGQMSVATLIVSLGATVLGATIVVAARPADPVVVGTPVVADFVYRSKTDDYVLSTFDGTDYYLARNDLLTPLPADVDRRIVGMRAEITVDRGTRQILALRFGGSAYLTTTLRDPTRALVRKKLFGGATAVLAIAAAGVTVWRAARVVAPVRAAPAARP